MCRAAWLPTTFRTYIVATENQQDATPAQPGVPAADLLSAKGAARRRFTRAGAGATGVLLTLASQPGMAADVCTTPSGWLSGGLKSHHGPAPVCSGVSPGYWKTHDGWPSPVTPDSTFGSIFGCNRRFASTYGAAKCGTILEHQSFDQANLGMHLVATYLNVLSGRISFLTISNVQAIWNEWQSKGYYTPTVGKKWYAADIVIYLRGTMA